MDHGKRPKVWLRFVKESDDKAKCSKCGKCIRCKAGCTLNLTKHYGRSLGAYGRALGPYGRALYWDRTFYPQMVQLLLLSTMLLLGGIYERLEYFLLLIIHKYDCCLFNLNQYFPDKKFQRCLYLRYY